MQSIASFLRGLNAGRARPSYDETAELNLPIEIIHSIIDDYLTPCCRFCDKSDLKALSMTCWMLAAFCRPLLWRYVTLIDEDSCRWAGDQYFGDAYFQLRKREMAPPPERWASLCKQHSNAPAAVTNLCIQVSPRMSHPPLSHMIQSTLLRATGGDLPQDTKPEVQQRLSVALSHPYPNITSLTVSMYYTEWDGIRPDLRATFLRLLQQPSVRNVNISFSTFPPITSGVFAKCPNIVSLRLSILYMPREVRQGTTIDEAGSTPQGSRLPPNLESLTLTGSFCRMILRYLCRFQNSNSSGPLPPSLKSLTIQDRDHASKEPTLAQVFKSVEKNLSSVTSLWVDLDWASHIDTSVFPSLQTLQLKVEERLLAFALDWTADALATLPLTANGAPVTLRRILILVFCHCSWIEAKPEACSRAWEREMIRMRYQRYQERTAQLATVPIHAAFGMPGPFYAPVRGIGSCINGYPVPYSGEGEWGGNRDSVCRWHWNEYL